MKEISGNPLHGLWALTNRELKKWYKEPFIFFISIIQPIIWMGLNQMGNPDGHSESV